MIVYRSKLFTDINEDIVTRYLGVLGGFIFKAKSLHWAASGKDIHEYLDDFWEIIYNFQDTVAECWMGINGQLGPDDVTFVAADSQNPKDFIKEVEDKTTDFYELLPQDDPRFKGLISEVENFMHEIEKYKYLFGLCM